MNHLLHAHNEEMKNKFNEEIGTFKVKVKQILPNGKLIPAGNIDNSTIEAFISTSHKSLYKKLLRKEMWEYYKTACRFGNIYDIPPNALLFLQGNINRLTAELSELYKDTN